MISFLKSRKLLWSVLGIVAVVVVIAACKALGLSEELTVKIVTFVAGFFGLSIAGHIVSDVTSMLKGLQKK